MSGYADGVAMVEGCACGCAEVCAAGRLRVAVRVKAQARASSAARAGAQVAACRPTAVKQPPTAFIDPACGSPACSAAGCIAVAASTGPPSAVVVRQERAAARSARDVRARGARAGPRHPCSVHSDRRIFGLLANHNLFQAALVRAGVRPAEMGLVPIQTAWKQHLGNGVLQQTRLLGGFRRTCPESPGGRPQSLQAPSHCPEARITESASFERPPQTLVWNVTGEPGGLGCSGDMGSYARALHTIR